MCDAPLGVYPEGILSAQPRVAPLFRRKGGLPWVNAALRITYPERV